MMPATKEAWEQVAETWRDLGSHLQEDYRKLSEAQVREAFDDRDKLTEAGRQLSATSVRPWVPWLMWRKSLRPS